MDQKGLKAKLIIERSVKSTGTTNRVKGNDPKGNSKGKLGGILRKNVRGKWEERKSSDRNTSQAHGAAVNLV